MCLRITKEVDKKVRKAGFDTTYKGIIQDILFTPNTPKDDFYYMRYRIFYNGAVNELYIRDGYIHNIGERVLVYVPNNVNQEKYVECISPIPYPDKVIWDNSTDQLIVERYPKTPSGDFTITKEFDFTITGKGTSEQKVTEVKFPNGHRMAVELR